MVNSKSSSEVDQPAQPCQAHNNPTLPTTMTMEQFLTAQIQFLQNLTNIVANMQTQRNQAPTQENQLWDKHPEFMSNHPPIFSHSIDPLDADNRLKNVEKKLDIKHCSDKEKVLYASGHLEGAAVKRWDAYVAAQMVNSKSRSGVDQTAQPCQARSNPTPPTTVEQLFAAQVQLLQNLTNIVVNMHAQQTQALAQGNQPWDKHEEFMSHCPLTFSHSADPLDADDWLKSVGKKLEITQCNDREKVLYASGLLEGAAAEWWDAYIATHTPNSITWDQFKTDFRSYHIPSSVMKIKKEEFFALKQRGMSVIEYRDKFIQLSRYAPKDVSNDEKRQEHFLEGLNPPIRYQLMLHTFPTFYQLVDKAISVEHAHREMVERKRKFNQQGQSSNNSRPRFSQPQSHGAPFRPGEQGGNFQQFEQVQRSASQFQHSNQHAKVPSSHRTPKMFQVKTCFKCGEVGHFANNCPKSA